MIATCFPILVFVLFVTIVLASSHLSLTLQSNRPRLDCSTVDVLLGGCSPFGAQTGQSHSFFDHPSLFDSTWYFLHPTCATGEEEEVYPWSSVFPFLDREAPPSPPPRLTRPLSSLRVYPLLRLVLRLYHPSQGPSMMRNLLILYAWLSTRLWAGSARRVGTSAVGLSSLIAQFPLSPHLSILPRLHWKSLSSPLP